TGVQTCALPISRDRERHDFRPEPTDSGSVGLGLGARAVARLEFLCDPVSPETFGHAGATGTVAWADPRRGVICVILTDRLLQDGNWLRRVSNSVAAAVRD